MSQITIEWLLFSTGCGTLDPCTGETMRGREGEKERFSTNDAFDTLERHVIYWTRNQGKNNFLLTSGIDA